LNPVDTYLDKLFNDAAFSALLTILSFWYAYYLFKRTPERNRLLIMTMSNRQKALPGETRMVIYTDSNADITASDLLNGECLNIFFDKKIQPVDLVTKFDFFPEGGFNLIKKDENTYQLLFNMIRSHQGIILLASHFSQRFLDTWVDIKILCTIKNFDIRRDDFSDQMVYRAYHAELPALLLSVSPALAITMAFKTLLKPTGLHFPAAYVAVGSLLISMGFIYQYVLYKAGEDKYKIFWDVIKRANRMHTESKQ